MNAREKPFEGNAGWATVRVRCTAAVQFVVQTFARSFTHCEVGPGAEKLEQNENRKEQKPCGTTSCMALEMRR